jgi:hypothetical protein
MAIPTQEEYEHKVNNLIQDNKFTIISHNPKNTTLPNNHKTNTKAISQHHTRNPYVEKQTFTPQ